VSSAMAGRLEKADGLKAELLRAEIVMVDEIMLSAHHLEGDTEG